MDLAKRAGTNNSKTLSVGFQPVTYFALVALGIGLRWACAEYVGTVTLSKYSVFNTPVVDIRDLRELFFTYEQTGSFFGGPT